MDLKFYLSLLWGNKWIIVTTVAITVIVTLIGTMMITPIYLATTTVRVATATVGSMSYYDYMYADRLMNTYTKIATSRPVLEELAERLNLQYLPDMKVTMISSTELIQITAKNPNPYIARSAANALAEILAEQSQVLYSGGEKNTTEILMEQLALAEEELSQARQDYETQIAIDADDNENIERASMLIDLKLETYETLLSQYEAARLREVLRANTITIVEPASLPLEPSQPKVVLNIGLGLIVGMLGGIGLVFLFENLNPRLYTIDQVEEVTENVMIGKIPSIKHDGGLLRLFIRRHKSNNAAFKESFQKLQAKILSQTVNGSPIKSLLITSAVPGEGKSTVVHNLALTMAKTGLKVIAVDCDMRRPHLHVLNDLQNEIGLSTLLGKQSSQAKTVQKTRHPNFSVLTSGPTPSSPMELLGSSQMRNLITSLSQKYDIVLIDTPALLPVGDAMILAPMMDAISIVIRQNISKEDTVREACKQLIELNTKIIGVVVNESNQNGSYYYYKEKSHTLKRTLGEDKPYTNSKHSH